jgi:hypothetical protein
MASFGVFHKNHSFKNSTMSWALVVMPVILNYSGGRDQEDLGFEASPGR